MRSKITFVTVLKAVPLPSANPPIGDKNAKRDIAVEIFIILNSSRVYKKS